LSEATTPLVPESRRGAGQWILQWCAAAAPPEGLMMVARVAVFSLGTIAMTNTPGGVVPALTRQQSALALRAAKIHAVAELLLTHHTSPAVALLVVGRVT
jgi:hypothetical protein